MSTPSHPLASVDRPLRIGLLVVATARYTRFVGPLLESARKHFMAGEQVTPYVFTDRPEELPIEAVALPVEHRAWPYATLLRYHHIARYRERLLGEDFVFQVDADMRFVGPVGREILPDTASGLVGVEHPGFSWRPTRWQRLWRAAGWKVPRGTGVRGRYPYESKETRSLAWIGDHEGEVYFAGGFTGGAFDPYLDMAASIRERIDRDLAQGIIAVWHDESHLNRHFINHPPKRLDSGYCYPEGADIPFRARLLALEKNHAAMREPIQAGTGGAAESVFATVYFGCAGLLRWQHASLRRHVRCPWKLVVFDNARLHGRRRESDEIRAICTELGVEWREVERDPEVEATAGRAVFSRRFFPRRLVAPASWSHAYALTWAWRMLAKEGRLGGFVGVLDSDLFLVRDLEPDRLLAVHELAFVPQHAPAHTYVWPGMALFAGARLPRLGELEWWPKADRDESRDTGSRSQMFLRQHREARVLALRHQRIEGLADEIRNAPEAILGPDSDEALAYHFRCGSGWDRASAGISRRKCAAILERVAWRDEVAAHPLF